MNARERLVEDDDIRVEHEEAGQLEQFLLPAAEGAAVFLGEVAHGEEIKHLASARFDLGFGLAGVAGPGGHHHVLEDGHAAQGAGYLEGAAEAGPGDFVGGAAVDGPAVEVDGPARGAEHPAHQIGEGGFAGAVGANHADELRAINGEGDIIHGDNTTKILADVM